MCDMQMDRFSKGIKVWASTVSRLLPSLRKLTDISNPCVTHVENRAIVLVEPRSHPALEFVLRICRHFLPEWRIICVHGTENEAFLKEIVKTIHGEFSFVQSGSSDLPPPLYNTLFTSPSFWNSLPSKPEWVLIVQTDTMLMRPAAAELEKLIAEDIRFVGAPWNYSCNACGGPLDGGCGHMIDQAVVASLAPNMVGNGGLSLRHVPSMLEVLDTWCLDAKVDAGLVKRWGKAKDAKPQKGTTNEDVFFCKCFADKGFKVADRAMGLEFAIEQIGPFEWKSEGALALGAHKPWAYLSDKLVAAMFDRVKI